MSHDVRADNFTYKDVLHGVSETQQCLCRAIFTRRQKRRRWILLKHKGSRSHFGFVCLIKFFYYLCSRVPLVL